MVSPDHARTVVGIIGNIISLILFFSPVPTFIQIWKKGSVENYSPVPYLATLVNCMVWVLYGLPMVHPNSTLVLTISGTGTVIEFVYIALFVIYSDMKQRSRVLVIVLTELVFIGVLAALVLTLSHGHTTRSLIVGIVGICFNIMMYAAPLSVMKLVITTKSVEYMPLPISLASFANCVAWSSYAFIRLDVYILGSNGVGTLLSLSQLILYAVFYKSTKRQIEERQAEAQEVGLSEITENVGPKKIGTGPQSSPNQ